MASCGRYGFDAVDSSAVVSGDAAGDATFDSPSSDVLAGLRAGCVVAMHMDEPSWESLPVGNDCIPSLTGSAFGNAAPVAGGVRGRAARFAGTGGITIPDGPNLAATNALTMSIWVYPTALDGSATFGLISKREDFGVKTAYSLFLWTGDAAYVDVDAENDRFASPITFTNNQWKQITVVYDGTLAETMRVRGYVDGALAFTAPETSASIAPSDAPLSIGFLPLSGPAQHMVGLLDEVVIWHRALSSAEVALWFTRTKP